MSFTNLNNNYEEIGLNNSRLKKNMFLVSVK